MNTILTSFFLSRNDTDYKFAFRDITISIRFRSNVICLFLNQVVSRSLKSKDAVDVWWTTFLIDFSLNFENSLLSSHALGLTVRCNNFSSSNVLIETLILKSDWCTTILISVQFDSSIGIEKNLISIIAQIFLLRYRQQLITDHIIENHQPMRSRDQLNQLLEWYFAS